MTTPSIARFRASFGTIFSDASIYTDEMIQMQLDEAMVEVKECIFKGYYLRATYYLAAHFLSLFHEQQLAASLDPGGGSSSNPKGVITSVSVGDLSLTQDMPEYSSSSDDKFLASTVFGQEFIRLRNKMSRGTLLARVPVIGNCPTVINGDYYLK